MPNLAVLLFILAMVTLLWVLHRHEVDQQRNALMRDAQWAEQTIHLHLHGNQELLQQLARDLAQGTMDADQFLVRASQHVANNPELSSIVWIGENGLIRWASPFDTTVRLVGERVAAGGEEAYRTARERGRPVYSAAFSTPDGDAAIELHVPMFRKGVFIGTMAGVYSVQGLLQHLVPGWFAEKYRLSVVDTRGRAIASSSGAGEQDPDLTHVIRFNPPDHGLGLRVTAFRTGSRLAQ
ncbi:MAG TPA: cache domain-containing protein, partial [Burkholderiales bacterium]|nr:cache domain-containing protein [Burkholderiales bacterium]